MDLKKKEDSTFQKLVIEHKKMEIKEKESLKNLLA